MLTHSLTSKELDQIEASFTTFAAEADEAGNIEKWLAWTNAAAFIANMRRRSFERRIGIKERALSRRLAATPVLIGKRGTGQIKATGEIVERLMRTNEQIMRRAGFPRKNGSPESNS